MTKSGAFLLIIAICTIVAAAVPASAAVGLQGLGFRVGVVDPDGVDATIGLGLVMDMGSITPNVALEGYSKLWWQSEGAFGTEWSVRDVAFGARTTYRFDVGNPGIRPYAGGGLGIHVMTAEVSTAPVIVGGTVLYPGSSIDDTELHLGLDLGGGVRFDSGGKYAFLTEFWYSVVNDFSHVALNVGLVYMFGR